MKSLLTVDQVSKFLPLAGGDMSAAGTKARVLFDLSRGLADGDADAFVLVDLYRTAYHIVAGRYPDTHPSDRLIAETQVASCHEGGRKLRQHFLAMGVLNGIGAANPALGNFAKLYILYSLDMNYSEVLELIAFGPLPL